MNSRLLVSVRWQSSLSSDRSKRCVRLLVVLLSGGTGIFRSLVMSFAQNGFKMCSSIQCSAGYVIACDFDGMAVGHECPTREKAPAVTTNEHIHGTLLISLVVSPWAPKSKHWFTTSFLGGRCRKAMLGVCMGP